MAVCYPHPSLKPVLERTLGVPLFQEQLLRIAMIAAGFSGGEAEELRRAFGFKRSERRMKEVEVRLREGMRRNGISGREQDEIVNAVTSFALYGFPESHAASFALLAYASAWLKCHYLGPFTAAILNNQPMGFYSPATLVKDAQRHGLKILPIDVQRSGWRCGMEGGAMRIGLMYVRGLRKAAGQALIAERESAPFVSIEDLARRAPVLQKTELVSLAEIGALNFLNTERLHRRDALWQVEKASRRTGPLLEQIEEPDGASPLEAMTPLQRLTSDLTGTGMTIGPHPLQYCRREMNALGVRRAIDLSGADNGDRVRIAGAVIARQRPGTAKGFVFLSLEDETGISNAIITPNVYDQYRLTIIEAQFLLIEGILQRYDNVTSVKATQIETLFVTTAAIASHDFH
jgi:error-prone DNA polymerase